MFYSTIWFEDDTSNSARIVCEFPYSKSHFTGVRDIWIGFPAEEIDEECGRVVHEHDDEEVVQHRDGLAEQGHAGRLVELQGVELHLGEVGGDDVRHLEQRRALRQLRQGQDHQSQDASEDVPDDDQ